MNKLLELFNQHKIETGTSYEYILFRDNDAGLQARCIDNGKEIYIVRQAEILSKKMGFIKWLVDNDKIDESKIEIHWFSFYESVLMELSIQDNPIEFLCSVLK